MSYVARMVASNEVLLYALLFGAGILSGFVNTLAGGGALFIMPVLLLLGFPPEVANATNRVGVSLQSALAARGLDRAARLDRGALKYLALPFSVGALLGALSAARIPSAVVEALLYAAMGIAALSLISSPKPREKSKDARSEPFQPSALHFSILTLLGFYAGLIQIGIGFLIVLFFLRLGYDLLESSALKLGAVVISTLISLIIFIPSGLVALLPALVLGASALIGAQLGVRYALKVRAEKLRRLVFTIFLLLIGLSLTLRAP